GVQFDRVSIVGDVSASEHARRVAQVQLLGLPGEKAFFDLLGKAVGIGGGAKSLACQHARSFVVAVAIAGRAAEAAGQHIRTEDAYSTHQVSEGDVMPVPLIESLFGGLGIAEIHHAAEALLYAVIFVGLQQLKGPQDAQLVRTLGAKLILTSLATSDRE